MANDSQIDLAVAVRDRRAEIEEHHEKAAALGRRHRQLLAARRREAEPLATSKLAEAISRELKGWSIYTGPKRAKWRLVPPKAVANEAYVIAEPLVRRILARAGSRCADWTQVHQYCAERTLSQLLGRGVHKSNFKAYIPSIATLGRRPEPSPFPKSSCDALDAAAVIRDRLSSLASRIPAVLDENSARRLLSVLWLWLL